MYSEPPPTLAPIPAAPPRKSKAKRIVAVIVVVILLGALGTYAFVLAPRMSVVDWSKTDVPFFKNATDWQYTFTVVVKNSGYLTGETTIVCEFSYVADSEDRTFDDSLRVQLKGGEQKEFTVQVAMPFADAVASILTQNKTASVHLD